MSWGRAALNSRARDRSDKQPVLNSARAFTYRTKWVPFLLWVAFASASLGQSNPVSQAGKSPTGAQGPLRSARASRVGQAPKLDGTLNDPLWQQAIPISNFLQREPSEGQTPEEHTED